jgi:hypothetical protein
MLIFDPDVNGVLLLAKLSVCTFDFGKLFTIRELLLLGTSTPIPAIPQVQFRVLNGLLVGSKSPWTPCIIV